MSSNIYVRLSINTAILVPFVFVVANPESASYWLAIPIFGWGFFALRQVLLLAPGGAMHIPVGPIQYLAVVVFGSMLCGAFGIIVLPVLIVVDIVRLVRK